MKKLLPLLALTLLMSCGASVERLEEEVIAIHDEVMPGMSTIHRLSKELAAAAGDSLRTQDQRIKIQTHIKALDEADEAMMTWMAEYKAPGADMPKEQALEMLQAEKVKITSVRDEMLSSIEEAKMLLKKLTKINNMRYLIPAILIVGAILGSYYFLTNNKQSTTSPTDPFEEAFPILGFKEVTPEGDTIDHSIPDFTFINQDSVLVTNESFAGKAYVADFFFIHCPSICPRVKAQMLRIYEKFEDNDNLLLLSHSIDTRNDTVPALRAYAEKLGVDTDKWQFVTGDKDLIFSVADEYFVSAMEAPDVAGGFDHSGRIILVDENRHIRSFAEGTDPEDVSRFLEDLEWFMEETYGSKEVSQK